MKFFRKIQFIFVSLIKKYLPDPFVLCALLTLIIFLVVLIRTQLNFHEVLKGWTNGFWGLLSFSMQMTLVLVLGHAMASSSFIMKALASVSSKLKSPGQGIVIVTLVSLVANWVNWGFGLVVGAIFAKEVAKNLEGIDYRLLIASAYSGFLVWHGGLSASIPLAVATKGNLSLVTGGSLDGMISVSDTIFSSFNLSLLATLTLLLPLLNWLMHPNGEEVVTYKPQVPDSKMSEESEGSHPLEKSRWLPLLLFSMAIGFMILSAVNGSFQLSLNTVNFLLLFLGLFLHQTPRRYLFHFKEAVGGASGILLQFPFYGGIMGLMMVKGGDGPSLAEAMSLFFSDISTPQTFPLFTFLSAGIVNFVVPSGGGQWAIQGPIVLPAAVEIGVSIPKTILALSWGDAWTNMIQPFWALPALGIAGLEAKDIMGFCLMILIGSGLVIGSFFLFL